MKIGQSNNYDQNIIKGPVDEQKQTRSGRIIKMPDKYNDYKFHRLNHSAIYNNNGKD